MKTGGTSWNKSPGHKAGITTRYICKSCGRQYKQDYNKIKHEKLCLERK